MFSMKGVRFVGAVSAVLILAVTAISAGPALASGGGQHQSGGSTTGGTAVLSISPNPVPAQTFYTISGSGFAPNSLIQMWVYEPDGRIAGGQLTTDGNGSFSVTAMAHGPGTYRVEANAVSRKKLTLLATTNFQVY